MIRNIFILLVVICSLFACNEDIVYRAPFEEEFILYSIINADSNLQFVMLKKSFSDKNSNENNYIKDASISLISDNLIEELKDTTINSNDIEADLYYTKNFKPGLGSKIKIRAELKNGKILTSSIIIPKFTSFLIDQFNLIIPPVIEPTFLHISWTLRNPSSKLAFLPRLTINYKIKKNNIETKHSYEIPSEYIKQGNENIPIYPTAIRGQGVVYPERTIETAFEEISKGDTDKSSYTIEYVDFEVFIMEENLTNYSASIQSFKNSYSVKIYEPLISNISNGLGVFGGYVTRGEKVPLDSGFVLSFGYNLEK